MDIVKKHVRRRAINKPPNLIFPVLSGAVVTHYKGRSNRTRITVKNSSQLMAKRPKFSLPASSVGSGFHVAISVSGTFP